MKAIIFGAGPTGQKTKTVLENLKYSILCFVDNSEKTWGKSIDGILVKEPKYILDFDFDQVAIASFHGVDAINEQLIGMGIDPEKIVVPLPFEKVFHNKDIQPFNAIKYNENEKLSRRFDILIRFLFVKNYVLHYKNNHISQLLLNFINPDKEGDIRKNISDKNFSLGNFENTYKELQRLSLDDTFWKKYYNKNNPFDVFNNINKSSNLELKLQILNSYIELSQNENGVLVLWDGAIEEFESFTSDALLEMNIVGFVDFDLENNLVGFNNLLRGILNKSRDDFESEDKKLNISLTRILRMRILLIENENNSEDFYSVINEKVYDLLDSSFNFYFTPTKEEYLYVSQFVFHKESLNFLLFKLPNEKWQIFFKMLHELEIKLTEYNIPKNRICITSGGILSAYGLQCPNDIDLIATSDLRKLFGSGSVIVSENIEFHPVDELEIADDQIVIDDNCHFYAYGFKFVNFSILYRYKKMNSYKESRLMDLFLKNSGCIYEEN